MQCKAELQRTPAKLLDIPARYLYTMLYASKVVCDVAVVYPCGGCFYYTFLFRIDQKSQSSIHLYIKSGDLNTLYSQYRKVYDNSTFSISQYSPKREYNLPLVNTHLL